MNLIVVIVVVVVIVLILAGGAALLMGRRKRSARLQQDFGPEYQRKVDEAGTHRKAESQLRDREKRHKKLELRSLSDEAIDRYREEWDGIQQRFVDEPGRAVEDSDRLATRIMSDRGYPVEDFEHQAADVSVDHPRVVQYYRDAHGVAVEQERGQADTEQLRGAVTSYRALIDALLTDAHEGAGSHEERGAPRREETGEPRRERAPREDGSRS